MNAKKIYDSEIESKKISSLPTRPTASTAFGGKGYTATEMKEAFDLLPLHIVSAFNTLIGDIESGELAKHLIKNEPFYSMYADIQRIKAALGL